MKVLPAHSASTAAVKAETAPNKTEQEIQAIFERGMENCRKHDVIFNFITTLDVASLSPDPLDLGKNKDLMGLAGIVDETVKGQGVILPDLKKLDKLDRDQLR